MIFSDREVNKEVTMKNSLLLNYVFITKFLHKYFCIHNSTCACAKLISEIVPIMKLDISNNGVVIMKKAFYIIKNVKLHSNLP